MSRKTAAKETPKLVIISPDESLREQLSQAVTASGIRAEPVLLPDYPTPARLRRMVDRNQGPLMAVIVGLGEQAQAVKLIEEFAASHPDILTIAADKTSSADRILAAMRAGASEFLAPPFELEHVVRRFEQQKKSPQSKQPTGQLICFMPAQGGNGSSTVALHVADAIRRELIKKSPRSDEERSKILLIDFDFHSGTVAFRLGLKPEFTLVDAVERTDILDELWDRLVSNWKGMDVLPAPPPGVGLPKERIEHLSSVFASAVRVYPYVVVDLPTALHSSCRDLLLSTDILYLVCTAEVISLHLARRRIKELEELGLPRETIRLVLNRVGSKRTLKVADVEGIVGVPISYTLDNDYSAVSDAYLKGGLVRADSALGRQLSRLAAHVVGTEEADGPDPPASRWRDFLAFE